MRADCVVRDQKQGILSQQVDSGLVQSMIGIERIDKRSIRSLNKSNNSYLITMKAFKSLNKFKEVYKIASVIYGLKDDRFSDLLRLSGLTFNPNIDQIFYIPFTPFPGTKYFDKKKKYNLSTFNFHRPIQNTKYLSTKQQELWIKLMIGRYLLFPDNIIRGYINRSRRVRNVQNSMTKALVKIIFNNIYPMRRSRDRYGIIPKWYND
jgi:radical SAM superfamily enzyme YgiQ (UPF0313 family)